MPALSEGTIRKVQQLERKYIRILSGSLIVNGEGWARARSERFSLWPSSTVVEESGETVGPCVQAGEV